jgi:hypothetical protein
LRSSDAQRATGVAANSTVQTIFDLKGRRLLPVPLPPPSERAAIQNLLCNLDGRIDHLDGINATLESIAQALFKSRFIDFDPVRAKAEGREPEGMDAATAALFPNEGASTSMEASARATAVGGARSSFLPNSALPTPTIFRMEPKSLPRCFSVLSSAIRRRCRDRAMSCNDRALGLNDEAMWTCTTACGESTPYCRPATLTSRTSR